MTEAEIKEMQSENKKMQCAIANYNQENALPSEAKAIALCVAVLGLFVLGISVCFSVKDIKMAELGYEQHAEIGTSELVWRKVK